jgi:hypothetical protein
LQAFRGAWACQKDKREDQREATPILYTLLLDSLSASTRRDDIALRTLLAETPLGDTAMQTRHERYRDQGRQEGWQQGEAAVLLRLIERKFGPPGEAVRRRIAEADAETPLAWSERVHTAEDPETVLH